MSKGRSDTRNSWLFDAVGILNLHFPDVIGWVKNTWSFVASTVANLWASYDSFKQTLFNIYDKVSNLVSYDYSKWASYVGTSNALASTDPAWRVIGLFWGSVVIKIEKVIDDLVTSRARKILLAIQFDDIQLQAKFAHAVDFWIAWNYNLANRDLFKQAIINHSKDPATKLILWTYRTTIRVNHFFNELTWNNVMYDLDWNFISWWRLDAEQINYLKTTKNIQ